MLAAQDADGLELVRLREPQQRHVGDKRGRELLVDERQHSGTYALPEAVGGKRAFTACLFAAAVSTFGR